MSRWFRVYADMVDDPKVQRLAPDLFKALINLWCLTAGNDGTLPGAEDIAFKLRIKPERVKQIISALHDAGLIETDEAGLRPHNWDGRQFKSDEAKESKGKDSYVYIIGRAWGADALKIGFSKNPWARVGELQTAHHEKLLVLAAFKCRSHSEVDLHDLLREFRKSGEWFSLPTNIYVAISNAADRKRSYDELVAELRELLRSTTTETEAENRAERKEDARPPAAPPMSDETEVYRRGKEILGATSGGMIKNLVKAKKGSIPHARAAIEIASTKENPREYIGAIIKGADPPDDARARGDAW